MFSSEQKFSFNGEDDKQLKDVLELASKWEPRYKFDKYSIEHGFFLFHDNYATSRYEDVRKFPPFARLGTVVNMIGDYLESPESQGSASQERNYDGSVNKGWEVFIPTWEDIKPKDYSIPHTSYADVFLAVRRDFIYYHK